MKEVKVVIGTNYGDEGKGNTVNYLSDSTTLNVRFNGGAQAGHTVVSGKCRHVFHSFGSGTFSGAHTYFGPEFGLDPVAFFKEGDELHKKFGPLPTVHVDPRTKIVTPYDVMLNQALERKRGDDRHGSCGMGFGEAIHRCNEGWPILFHQSQHIKSMLHDVEQHHFWPRVEKLCLEVDKAELKEMLKVFYEDFESLIDCVNMTTFTAIEKHYPNIVFEGAQGLCLDQNSSDFPHVTYSNTGLDNVVDLLNKDRHTILVHYVTRTYQTRHGAGQLFMEGKKPERVVDETNIHNEFQGSLRFGPLDFSRMRSLIVGDLLNASAFRCEPKMMITCCDQVDIDPAFIADKLEFKNYESCWSADGDWRN